MRNGRVHPLPHLLSMPTKNSRAFKGGRNSETSIVREDWDFCLSAEERKKDDTDYKGCSEEELFDCFEYEFSRTAFHAKNLRKRDIEGTSPRQKAFYRQFREYFPATPWLKIPESIRRAKRAELEQAYPTSKPVFRVPPGVLGDGPSDVQNVFGVGPGGFRHITVLLFAISWENSNAEIVASFKAWLAQFEPTKTGACKVKQPGKDEYSALRTALKKLGAWRVLNLCGTIPDAERLTQSQRRGIAVQDSNPLGLYTTPSTWKSAHRNAQAIIDAWVSPTRSLIQRSGSSLAELQRHLSPANRPSFSQLDPLEWLQQQLSLPWSRRLLTLSAEKLVERLQWAFFYPRDTVIDGFNKARKETHWEEECSPKP